MFVKIILKKNTIACIEFINEQSEVINKLSLKEQRLEEYKKLLTIVTAQAAINQVEENIKKYC